MATDFSSANRKALDHFQDTRVQLGMSEKKEKLATKVYGAIGGFLMTGIQVAVKEIGKIDLSSFSSIIDFYEGSQYGPILTEHFPTVLVIRPLDQLLAAAIFKVLFLSIDLGITSFLLRCTLSVLFKSLSCSVMMINTMSSIRMSYPNLCEQDSLQALRSALANKRILISFYGDSNVGKSTILNAIMGDRYLPANRQTETAISVEIQFQDHRSDTPYEAAQNDVLEVKRNVLATGAKEIKEMLQVLNKTSREDSYEFSVNPPEQILIKLRRPCVFTAAVSEVSFSLVDTPGCNEYDTGIISYNVQSAENFSSAFIFVTTLDTYRDGKFSTILKKIYFKHPEIIKQNRLTIVINKVDDALGSAYDESCYSAEDVINIVRNYFCKTIFNISPQQMPKNSVILVGGTWASYARCFKKFPHDERLQKCIEMETKKLLCIDDFEVAKSYPNLAEDPLEKKAELLEQFSNVKQLEDRLVMMSKCSLKIWKLKMASDICDEKNDIISEIKKRIQSTRNIMSELSTTTEKHFKVVASFNDFYFCIHSEYRKSKRSGIKSLMIWKKFKEACDKDMMKESNILTILLNAVSESLEAFKATISDKMSKGLKAEVLEKDLEDLLNSLSQKLDRYMSSQQAFEALSEMYHQELMSAHGSCVLLRSELHSIINSKDGSKIKFEGPRNFGHIELAGPRFSISLNIPLQLSFFQKFLKKFREFFKLAAKSEEEFFKFQFSDSKKSSFLESKNESFESTFTNDLQSSHRIKQPNSYDNIHATESTILRPEMSVDDQSDDDSSISSEMKEQSLKSSTYSDTREWSTYYTKWSSELEDVKIKIQEGVNLEVNKFFEDIDAKVVSIYCHNYYESIIDMLKLLDKSTQEEMNKCIAIVESSMAQLQRHDESLRLLTDHHQKLNKLWCDFESMMKKIS